MSNEPFIYIYSSSAHQRTVEVPSGHEGFVLHDSGRVRLTAGTHQIECEGAGAAAVFLVCTNGAHHLEVRSLSGAMLRCTDGPRRPIQLLGRFVYSVTRPELFVGLLQREKINEMRALERELERVIASVLANVFEGEPLSAESLSTNLDGLSGELRRRLDLATQTCGIVFQGVDLLAEPAMAGAVSRRT